MIIFHPPSPLSAQNDLLSVQNSSELGGISIFSKAAPKNKRAPTIPWDFVAMLSQTITGTSAVERFSNIFHFVNGDGLHRFLRGSFMPRYAAGLYRFSMRMRKEERRSKRTRSIAQFNWFMMLPHCTIRRTLSLYMYVYIDGEREPPSGLVFTLLTQIIINVYASEEW